MRALLLSFLALAPAMAQDIPLGVTYVCSGERLYVENCNIRDTSDTSTCMVGHPDRPPSRNGTMAYTYETRGTLKKLLPTCQQPSAKALAAAAAREKKQQDTYDANMKKATEQVAPPITAAAIRDQLQGAKSPEERAMNRCIAAGRLPASCTGNALLGAFSNMLSSVLPQAGREDSTSAAIAGPQIAGVYQGAGNWRLDFTADGVLVNCSFLAPDEHHYTFEFKNNVAGITIDTTPKPLTLAVKPDGTIVGPPGPIVLDGVIPGGTTSGSGGFHGYRDRNGRVMSDDEAARYNGTVYDSTGRQVPSSALSQTVFIHKRATCPGINLSSKGASVGIQTMQTDLLKTMFGGDKGPPTPAGIRMKGIYGATTGFSAQFFPESVILGCGPDAARAYPYTVVADGTKAFIRVDAPDHPLTLTFRPDRSLDAGAGPYQVHGRTLVGQNSAGDYAFIPFEQTCNLAVLTPSKTIPATSAPAGQGATAGSSSLTILTSFPPPSPLAGHPYMLLRDSYQNVVLKGGFSIPQGVSVYKFLGEACAKHTPDCQGVVAAVKANTASTAVADGNGKAIFNNLAPGTYYLMISTRYNNQPWVWVNAVEVKAGANSFTLDMSNATPMN